MGNRITGIQWRTMDIFGTKQMQSRAILRLIKKQGERTRVKRRVESRSKLEQLNKGGGKAESKVMAEDQRNTFKLDQRGLVKRSSITSSYALQVLWVTWVMGWEWTEKGDLKPSIHKDPEKYLSAPPILWHLLTCIVYKGNVNAFPGIQENPPE